MTLCPSLFRTSVAALALALLSPPQAARAQEVPGLFDVAEVAAADVLNIRAEPSASAPVIGSFDPDAKGIEVLAVSDDGKWGMVSTGESDGWVALRFLQPLPGGEPGRIPRPMTCFGTEPFWSIALGSDGLRWSSPEDQPQNLSLVAEKAAPEGYFISATGANGQDSYDLTITKEYCSDGMSDRSYGYSARLFRSGPDGNRLMRACCTMEQR